jgi:hypothetical protein
LCAGANKAFDSLSRQDLIRQLKDAQAKANDALGKLKLAETGKKREEKLRKQAEKDRDVSTAKSLSMGIVPKLRISLRTPTFYYIFHRSMLRSHKNIEKNCRKWRRTCVLALNNLMDLL